MEMDFHAYLHTSYSAMVVVETVKEFSGNFPPTSFIIIFPIQRESLCSRLRIISLVG